MSRSRDELYAGGELDQKYLRYKTACLSEEEYTEKRLRFERKGTPTECIRKGYGMGLRHQISAQQQHQAEPTEHDRELRREQDLVLENWDEPFTEVYTRTEHLDDFGLELYEEDRPTQNVFVRRRQVTDERGQFLQNVLRVLEAPRLEFSDDVKNADFFGWEELLPELRYREYRFLEQSFHLKRIRNVFSRRDLQRMFRVIGQAEPGSLLFAMPLLTPDLTELPWDNGFVLCEVDFNSMDISFFAPRDAYLVHYRNIMLQQFVMPRNANWRVGRMHVDRTLDLLYVLARRILNHTVTQAQIDRLSDAFKTHYVLEQLWERISTSRK